MIIYTEHISPRLNYIANFIVGELLGVEYVITSNKDEITGSGKEVINYSENKELSGFHIHPHRLLSETDIIQREIQIEAEGEFPVFYKTEGKDLNFDIFSASFFILSRYEEYGKTVRDKYGRYKASNSLALQNNFLHLPVINIWTEKLRSLLLKQFPNMDHKRIPASFSLSLDIDNPWAHLNKSFFRLVAGIMKSISTGRWDAVRERISVLQGKEKDPYDNYEFIRKNHDKELLIFILTGDKGKNDNKVKIGNNNWRKLIEDLSVQYNFGLHPSFHSNSSFKILKREKLNLEEITGQTTKLSRQHFLLMEFPSTYENIISLGIDNDFSMGYPDHVGFRAGTSSSFNFYNLVKEEETSLIITPFCVMDRTLKDYLKLDQILAFELIQELIDQIHKYGGNFVSIWHNESFSGKGEWKEWDHLYLSMLKELNRKFTI